MNKKLLDAFNIQIEDKYQETIDYEVFQDKELLEKLRIKILEDLSNKGLLNDTITVQTIDSEINNITKYYNISTMERNHLYNLVENEIQGYGPLTELLSDNNITEIMVNSPKEIYIEIDGRIQKDDSISFIDNNHIIRTIEKLISQSGKSIDINNPIVDARLSDGSRINAIIPPLSKNPVITIRKFMSDVTDIENLIGNGTLTPYMARFLSAAVKARLNILVSGGTGSGKTTLLNILSNYINDDERIITIEDSRELNLNQSNVVSLETKSTNYDGLGEITIRDLVRNSLRMRPDRIVIGEIRGGEAFDLLQAMNTGHEGSLTTLHANSSHDALSRLETMVLMDGIDLPIKAVRKYIDNAVDIIVHISRMRDGKRKITSISEVVDVQKEEFVIKDIFTFETIKINENGQVEGEYKLLDYKPKCLDKIEKTGDYDLKDIFK